MDFKTFTESSEEAVERQQAAKARQNQRQLDLKSKQKASAAKYKAQIDNAQMATGKTSGSSTTKKANLNKTRAVRLSGQNLSEPEET